MSSEVEFLDKLAEDLSDRGDYDTAIIYSKQALTIWESVDPKHFNVVTINENIEMMMLLKETEAKKSVNKSKN